MEKWHVLSARTTMVSNKCLSFRLQPNKDFKFCPRYDKHVINKPKITALEFDQVHDLDVLLLVMGFIYW